MYDLTKLTKMKKAIQSMASFAVDEKNIHLQLFVLANKKINNLLSLVKLSYF